LAPGSNAQADLLVSVGKLVVPTIPRQQPAKLLDDDERWRLLQRFLTDTALPVDVRAATWTPCVSGSTFVAAH
jgi:hypothetical protein